MSKVTIQIPRDAIPTLEPSPGVQRPRGLRVLKDAFQHLSDDQNGLVDALFAVGRKEKVDEAA